ncbi:hypothetical protein RJ639_013281 [Escallonia herrerae]|uniref:Uncharacterized protein n=1 Tax=Escallonia herrerae TaxID=1293975 RepID=A0AA88VHU9_9ASTE|nr:hypothetical protein RJ639_013281 [Escallonia herrerae]
MGETEAGAGHLEAIASRDTKAAPVPKSSAYMYCPFPPADMCNFTSTFILILEISSRLLLSCFFDTSILVFFSVSQKIVPPSMAGVPSTDPIRKKKPSLPPKRGMIMEQIFEGIADTVVSAAAKTAKAVYSMWKEGGSGASSGSVSPPTSGYNTDGG